MRSPIGVPVEFRLVRLADVETIQAMSGQHMVPILCDGDRVIQDSWKIACYLEDRFPDHPTLFGDEAGRGLARLVNHWSDIVLGPAVRRLISADFIFCLTPEDRDYFRRSREAAFSCTLEEYCADRPRWVGEFAAVVEPLERTLAEQPYFGGANPTYADYLLFSVFQYARFGCPDDFIAEGTAVHRWRDGLALAFDGLGHRYPAHPAYQPDTADGR
jgi:glutathione S-transferase